MTHLIKARAPLLALVLFVLGLGDAFAQNKVVVIPLIGDDTGSAIPIADVKDLGTTAIGKNITTDVVEISPIGSNVGSFVVPNGRYFVITAMSVFPVAPGAGTVELQLIQNSAARKYWKLSNLEPTHLSFGPGMLIAPNYALKIKNFNSSANSIRVSIYGYLTDA